MVTRRLGGARVVHPRGSTSAYLGVVVIFVVVLTAVAGSSSRPPTRRGESSTHRAARHPRRLIYRFACCHERPARHERGQYACASASARRNAHLEALHFSSFLAFFFIFQTVHRLPIIGGRIQSKTVKKYARKNHFRFPRLGRLDTKNDATARTKFP